VDDAGLGLVSFGGLAPAMTYCRSLEHSGGCTPRIDWSGAPSATLAQPFELSAQEVRNQVPGMLIYGFTQAYAPFGGGILCIKTPIRRTELQNGGGNVGPPDCSGSFSYDMQARIQAGSDPMLVPGAVVYAQFWYRDPPSASGMATTDAVQFVIDV